MNMSRLYEDFHVGDVYRSGVGRTVTETDNLLFTMLTMNTNELHFNVEAAARTEFGRILVNSTFTLALVLGLSVADTSQAGAVNLGWESVRLPAPVFAGFSAVAAVLWAVYGALLGYFGGRTFHDKPWLALLIALGIAGGVTIGVEGLRRVRERA